MDLISDKIKQHKTKQRSSVIEEETTFTNNLYMFNNKNDILLTKEEKLTIELFLERKEKFAYMINNLAAKAQNLQLVVQNLELKKIQYQNDIKNISNQIEEQKKKVGEIDSEYNSLIETISNKYNIGLDWEFDNDTGKITELKTESQEENVKK